MRKSIVKQNDASKQIGKEEADKESELEALSFSHSIPEHGLPALLSMDNLVPSSSLCLLQKRLLFGTFLYDFASLPNEPNLAHHEDSDKARDQHSDDRHVGLARRLEAFWLSVYNCLCRLFRNRKASIVRILLIRNNTRDSRCWSHLKFNRRTSVMNRWIGNWN